jgi:NADPH2 dehydrogenase
MPDITVAPVKQQRQNGTIRRQRRNRIRFPLHVVNAVCDAIGPERVGARRSPFTRFQGIPEAEPLSLFVPWAQAIVDAQPLIAYIHAIEPRAASSMDTPEHLRKVEDTLAPVREVATRAGVRFIVAGDYTPERALQHTDETDDLVAFERHFIRKRSVHMRYFYSYNL